MVLSVAGMAMANSSENHTHILYYNNSESISSYANSQINLSDSGTTRAVPIQLQSAPTRSGYSFTGFNIYDEWGNTLATNVAADSSVTVTLNRYHSYWDWPYIYVVGQWTRTYIGSTLDHIDVRIPATVTIAGVTYPASVLGVSGTLNGASKSFGLTSGEYRNGSNFTHQLTNVVVLNVALRVNLGDGDYLDTTATLTLTGDALTAAIANCPGSGSSKGYDFDISVAQLSDAIDIEEEDTYYTLTYQITSSFEGQPAAPANYAGYGEPTLEPATPFDGYNFFGWSTLQWNTTGTDVVMIDEVPTLVTYKEATVTGEYTKMQIIPSQTPVYSLLFTGYADGMLFWPADVINSDTQPEADGVPYLAGYEFLGWTPEDLNWAGASISYIYRVVTPVEGGVPYIEEIPVYTITVNATFNQDVPAEPEIPTGVPATGDASWIVFAGIILLVGSAVGGYALIRRKDS
jgi:hypothetical protein